MEREIALRAVIAEMPAGQRILNRDGYMAGSLEARHRAVPPDWGDLHQLMLSIDLGGREAEVRAAKLLTRMGYIRDPGVTTGSSDSKLSSWRSGDVTAAILLRLRVVQAMLRFLEKPGVDAVEEIRREYALRRRLQTENGQAIDNTAASRIDVNEKDLIEFLKSRMAGVPHDRPGSVNVRYTEELVDHLNAFVADKGMHQSDVIAELLRSAQRNHRPRAASDDPFAALGLEGLKSPVSNGERQKPAKPEQIVPTAGKLRKVISEEKIANGVAQYLTNFGRGAIQSDFVFASDGMPTVRLYANEPLCELILRAHARHTFSRTIRCRNPRCPTGPFQASRPNQLHCERPACREYVKKLRQRSISTATKAWAEMTKQERQGNDRSAWVAAQASLIASDKAGGPIVIAPSELKRRGRS